ncbi:MAG: hypothetical protein HXY43_08565 [Fischerella sp.]|jgi:hypothetical protein|uniref:hypothetical protein n=1 Tax=Fischerella sp. TaxID=1191 RepID=UPI0017C80093|nr:hypothetical protein [Fischerella sp.]NWF59344.1 hypothetical protein [Fischerella sp.]
MRHPFHLEIAEIKATGLIFEELSNDESEKISGGSFSSDFFAGFGDFDVWKLSFGTTKPSDEKQQGVTKVTDIPGGKQYTYINHQKEVKQDHYRDFQAY